MQEFSSAEISAATEKFSESRIVGKGGFGVVYVGYIRGSKEGKKQLKPELTALTRYHYY